MRNKESLIALLSGLVKLLSDESESNPEFAARLERLFAGIPQQPVSAKKSVKTPPPVDLPDIHAEWNSRGEVDFRLWLRKQPVPVLRAIIRSQDIDSTSRTTKWKEAEKLADFIADNLRSRLSRGSAFLGKSINPTANFAPELFEKRFKVFKAIRAYISACLSGNCSNSEAMMQLFDGTDGARFLFDDDAANFIEEIRVLGITLDTADVQLRSMQPGDERNTGIEARRKIRDRLELEGRNLEQRLSKYLSVQRAAGDGVSGGTGK